MTTETKIQIKLSTLWIIVMLNMIFIDIYSIMIYLVESRVPDIPGDVRTLMLIAVVITNIPIAMIYFSRVLPRTLNRRVNFIGGGLTILYVIGGADTTPSYIAGASIEVALLCVILWIAARWPAQPNEPAPV